MPFNISPARFNLKSLIDIIYFYMYITLPINIAISGNTTNAAAIPIKLHGLRATGI